MTSAIDVSRKSLENGAIEAMRHRLTVELGLTDAEITLRAVALAGEYDEDDVVNLSQEQFDELMRTLNLERAALSDGASI